MKILSIPAYSSKVSPIQSNNSNYIQNNLQTNISTPSFTGLDLFKIVNKSREKTRINQLKQVFEFLNDDVKILSKKLNKSEKEVSYMYGDDLKIGGNNRFSRFEGRSGLGKLVGYPLEKMALIREAIVPTIKKVTNKFSEIEVPNGIIFEGKGLEKEKAADALLEHYKLKDPGAYVKTDLPYESKKVRLTPTNVIQANWAEGDTKKNIEALCKPFEEARINHKFNGTHSAILIKNVDEIFNSKNSNMLKLALQYETQNASKNGLTWVITTENAKKLPKWLTKKENTLSMEIDTLKSDFEKSLVLSDEILNTARLNKTDAKSFYEIMEIQRIPQKPTEIHEIIQAVNKRLSQNDYKNSIFGEYVAPVTDDVAIDEIINYKF